MIHRNSIGKNYRLKCLFMDPSFIRRQTMEQSCSPTTLDWPYSRYRKLDNGTFIGEGFAFELLELLIRKFKFTYTIIPPVKDVIGDEKSGMIQQLKDKQVDMAVAFLPLLSQFRNFCDYSTPLDEMDTTFLMKRPAVSSSGSGLLAPFSTKVWLFILLSLLVVGPTIFIFITLRSKFAKDPRAEKFNFLTCMWFVYGALLKQGTTISPIGDSTRLVFATWWIFITILTSFYTANLTAFLTLSKFTISINTLDNLVDYGYYWFIINGRSIERMMHYDYHQTQLLSRSKRYFGSIYNDYDMSYANILRHADRGKIFVTDRILAKMAIFDDYRNKTMNGLHEDRRCTYVISDKNALPIVRAFGFQLNSTIKERMDKELIQAVECGLIKQIKSKNLTGAQICPLNLKSKERRLKVSDLWMTYKVVFCGMGVGLVIFMLELCSKLISMCVNSEWFRACCKNGQIRGTSPPENTWAVNEQKSNVWTRTPPPVYQFSEEWTRKTYSINGRDYYIIIEEGGDRRLVPIRSPSAHLFQHYIN